MKLREIWNNIRTAESLVLFSHGAVVLLLAGAVLVAYSAKLIKETREPADLPATSAKRSGTPDAIPSPRAASSRPR